MLLVVMSAAVFGSQIDLKTKLQTSYDEVEKLILRKDIRGVSKLLTETRTSDYILDAKSGKHALTDVIRSLSTVLPTFDKVTRATVHIDHLTVKGPIVIATITANLVLATKPLQDGKVHTIAEEATGDDTWVRVGDKWKLKLSKVLKSTFYRDGKQTKG